MPVAARRDGNGTRFSSVKELFGFDRAHNRIDVRADLVCTRVLHEGGRARGIEVRETPGSDPIEIRAGTVVIAAGTTGTPKLIAGSGLDAGDALGRYVFDHPAIGSRVVLKDEILEGIAEDDPLFTVWVPYTPETPWHNQICRFPSNPSPIEPDCPPGNTGDIFTFSSMDVRPENRFIMEPDRLDPWGLPEYSAAYELTDADNARLANGLAEHLRIAGAIGDLVRHRWFPTFFGPGWSTHMMGSCRMGAVDDGTSCVDPDGKLWGYDGIYVAGNAVLPVSNAGNPTIMAIALGLKTAGRIADTLQ
jgi:choline dehydrogenase-like flavoprotein